MTVISNDESVKRVSDIIARQQFSTDSRLNRKQYDRTSVAYSVLPSSVDNDILYVGGGDVFDDSFQHIKY